MRQGPEEVRQWFDVAVPEDTFGGYLTALHADPNWRVLSLPGHTRWTLNLVYWPTGEKLEIVLQRVGKEWRQV